MGLFRRRSDTLNEKLLREAGLDPAQALGDSSTLPPLEPPRSILSTLGLPHDLRLDPREWDAAVTVTASGLAGDEIKFTTIPDGDVIVAEETGDADVSPLAEAIERRVDPPYRAVAQRQEDDIWAVCARRIEVAQIPFPDGDKLELSWSGNVEELRVDGETSDAAIPRQLEEVGEVAGPSYFVEALRIDGDLWEVRATAL
ncbi:MAG: hypothetical protein ACRDKC_05825 [Gaiellaceae bacterium]